MLQMPHTCTGFLIVFIFSTGVVNAEPDAVHRRAKRNSFQFGSMVEHTTGRDPLDFIDYGCYCGLGGFGTPVDGLDECCKKHDKCWTKVGLKDSSCNFLGGVFTIYDYKITKRGKIKCKDERGSCERGFCQCDKKAALCFANQPYLDEHYDIDLDIC